MLVFTKKKYVKTEGKRDYRGTTKIWVDKCNGREVIKTNDGLHVKGTNYMSVRKWCKEV